MSQQQCELFGGAIVVKLPIRFIDASEIRQVPDNQEVFLSPDSAISIIIEILERVEPDGNHEAAMFHFDSLAHDNDAQLARVDTTSVMMNDRGDDTPSPIILSGTQIVRKFNRQSADEIRVFMAIYRIESKRIDLVLTMNVPVGASEGDAVDELGIEAAKADFDVAATSLHIIDYSLFA